jgi:tRNA pseudouridine38-40 synthase
VPRYKLTLQYDGSRFFGWQKQTAERTVQGVLEAALAELNEGERVPVTGAGRTDTGVHALGQVAHFDLTTHLDTATLLRALNARLPEDLRGLELATVSADFHARYSAIARHYRYQCYSGANLLYRNQAWLTGELELSQLQSAAALVQGEHDFLSFSKWDAERQHHRCTVYRSEWTRDGKMIVYHIAANRFLHHMIRYLVGCMVAIAQGRFTMEAFTALLTEPRKAVKLLKAPPQGLILEKVDYA